MAASASLYDISSALLSDTEQSCRPWAVSGDVCRYVQLPVCQDSTGLVPYLQIHYCWLSGWSVVSQAVLLLWAVVMMLTLTVVAARFFRPALADMVVVCGLSEDGAGATLLSLSNGIPHVVKQFTAADGPPGALLNLARSPVLFTASRGAAARAASTPLAIAMPVAMGVLATNVTLAAVAFVSGVGDRRRSSCRCGALVDPGHFLRDLAFYSAALLLTAVLLSYGKVTIWPPMFLLALYLAYMCLFVSCKRRALSTQHSVHSALLVAEYQSLQHALLSRSTTWRTSSIGNSSLFRSPSEASSPRSQMSPRRHRANGANGAAAARPPTRPSGDSSSSAARASVTLFPVRLEPGGSMSQSTPRFGGSATGSAPANSVASGSKSGSTHAMHALNAAQDSIRSAFDQDDPVVARHAAAHDFDGAVGPSTQILRDIRLLPQPGADTVDEGGGPAAAVPSDHLRTSIDSTASSRLDGSNQGDSISLALPPSAPLHPTASAAAAASPLFAALMHAPDHSERPDRGRAPRTGSRRGRRRSTAHGAGAVGESAQPRDTDEAQPALPRVVPSESSPFEPPPAHSAHAQHNSVVSVHLSSVGFPSTPAPGAGPSCCECDLPSVRPDPPPEQHHTPADPSSDASALSIIADLPRHAWASVAPPLTTIVRAFMPMTDAAETDPLMPLFTAMLPVTVPLFIMVTQKLAFYPGSPISTATVLYGTGCSLFSSVLLYTVYPPAGTPDGDRRVCFAIVTLCMSRVWMFLLAAETNHVFRTLGHIHGRILHESLLATPAASSGFPADPLALAAAAMKRSAGVLSATVYEWVDMAPDFAAIVGVASAGLTATAVAGCFGTPIFMMTVGTGLALLWEAAQHGAAAWDASAVPWVALGFAAATAVRLAALVPLLHRWRITWAAAVSLIIFYIVFEAVYIWVCL